MLPHGHKVDECKFPAHEPALSTTEVTTPARLWRDWFDCLVDSAVAASIQKATLSGTGESSKLKGARVRLSSPQRSRRKQ